LKLRTFVAIKLPQSWKENLTEIQNSLKQRGNFPVKWVNPANIHLTLKFLGDVESQRVPEITNALKEAVSEIKPFDLMFEGVGAFPNLESPRVVWVGMGGDVRSLLTLQGRVDDSLSTLGFSKEKRDFSPHLTLGRVRDRAQSQERRMLGKTLSQISSSSAHETGTHHVESLNLMRSELTREGAIYSSLASVNLSF
jgi:2'-5' RNA ligase